MIFEDEVPEGVEELNVTLSLQDPSLESQVMVEPAVATVRIRDIDSKFDCFLQQVWDLMDKKSSCWVLLLPLGDLVYAKEYTV